VGWGGGVDEVVGALGAGAPPPTDQSPVSTPVPRGANFLNTPAVRSRPPGGQPGHLSTIVAETETPLHVIVIDFPQNGELPGVLPN